MPAIERERGGGGGGEIKKERQRDRESRLCPSETKEIPFLLILLLLMASAPQVVLSGPSLHGVPSEKAPANGTAATASGAAGEGIKLDADPGANHPLRPYWEYLSYLFRKLDALNDDEVAMLRYRDYLQVRNCSSSVLPLLQLSREREGDRERGG